jgi:membrane protease YdiL (CAAX protease family)
MISIPDLVFATLLAVAWPLYATYADWPAFQRRLARDPSRARLVEYRRTIAQQWVLAAIAIVLWRRTGRPWAALGLQTPEGWRLWTAAALLLAFAALHGWQLARIARSPATRAHLRGRFAAMGLAGLLPHTLAELGWMFALSLTAGFCEELLFRGYFIAVLAPWLGWWGAAALGVPVFGLLHGYQGRGGVVRTAIVGAVMTLLVGTTRSLIPAMALHAVIDIASGTAGWTALHEQPAAAATA